MFARSRSSRRGVSLAETMVSLLILTIVMITALTLLFSMKSFAERQQVKTAPRQTSRRAIDYLSTYVAGATDLNDIVNPLNPNAVVTWYSRPVGAVNVPKQASFNNLPAGSALGEPGTDILTVAFPTSTAKVQFTQWSGTAHTLDWLDYREGCPTTATMQQNFMQLSGATGAAGSEQSAVLMAIDANGSWAYYQITSYQAFACGSVSGTGQPNPVQVIANPVAAERVNPVTGEPILIDPVFLYPGMRFLSFRVRRDGAGALNLEQKTGLFDPDTDNPGTAFTPIMPDVEDLQVAYLYSQTPDGSGRTVFNTFDAAAGADVLVTGTGNVPPQGTGTLWDVSRIAGIRLSITSRSAPLRFETARISVRRKTSTLTNLRPRSEDRAEAAPDAFEAPSATTGNRIGDYDHHRMTSTVLLRNRMLGN